MARSRAACSAARSSSIRAVPPRPPSRAHAWAAAARRRGLRGVPLRLGCDTSRASSSASATRAAAASSASFNSWRRRAAGLLAGLLLGARARASNSASARSRAAASSTAEPPAFPWRQAPRPRCAPPVPSASASARHLLDLGGAGGLGGERLRLGLGADLGGARLGEFRRVQQLRARLGRRDGLAPLVVLGLDQVVPRLDPQPRDLRFRSHAPRTALDRARADVGPQPPDARDGVPLPLSRTAFSVGQDGHGPAGERQARAPVPPRRPRDLEREGPPHEALQRQRGAAPLARRRASPCSAAAQRLDRARRAPLRPSRPAPEPHRWRKSVPSDRNKTDVVFVARGFAASSRAGRRPSCAAAPTTASI